jgi:hypothetical protein
MAVSGVVRDMSPEPLRADTVPRRDAMLLWLVAVICFGAGDVLTTAVGLRLAGVVEVQPIAAHLFEYSVLWGMVLLKTAVFGGCYVVWRCAPEPYSVGVPLGLAALGTVVVAWNIHVLLLTAIQ